MGTSGISGFSGLSQVQGLSEVGAGTIGKFNGRVVAMGSNLVVGDSELWGSGTKIVGPSLAARNTQVVQGGKV